MIKDLCFEIIQKCPNNCLFCSSNSNFQKDCEITLENFIKTITFFVENGGIKEVSLSGGEPLLHKDVVKMVEFCSSLGINTTLYTSGIIKNSNIININNPLFSKLIKQINTAKFSSISIDLLKNLKNAGLNKIVFDFQASEEDEYNELMGTKGNYTSLLNSIVNVKKFNFETSIHFIPNKINVNQFKDVVELAELAGINEVRVLKFVAQGRGRSNKNELQLSSEELFSFVKNCNNVESDSVKIKIGIPLQNENSHKCTAGIDKIDIRYDGQILPCPAFKDIPSSKLEKFGFNNVNIHKNLHDFKFVPEIARTKPLCAKIHK